MIYYYSISAILSGFWMIMFLARFEGKKINYYFTIFSMGEASEKHFYMECRALFN